MTLVISSDVTWPFLSRVFLLTDAVLGDYLQHRLSTQTLTSLLSMRLSQLHQASGYTRERREHYPSL